ncbi:MAG: 3-dehydroquinate synthase [Chloroflexota bacterium]|nr:3-dehydroquinate synthase [Chloroflexota bacterium]
MTRNNIIITGFSGTGKSTVANTIADILGWEVIDTDNDVVSRTGLSISRIFQENGEASFRQLERQAVQEACAMTGRVIAVGGGAVMEESTRQMMEDSGFVVCLEARPETIYRRLNFAEQSSKTPEIRPLLHGHDPLTQIRELKAQRQPIYALAHCTVHTDTLTVEQVAKEILMAWRNDKTNEATISNPFADHPDLAATVETSVGLCPLLAGWGLIEQLGSILVKANIQSTVYIITDDKVSALYSRSVQRSLQEVGIEAHTFVFPAGEKSKSLAMAEMLYQWLASRQARRDHTLLALGGGVVGDLTGFVAATYNRGMGFVQVPTSLAAMVDASIGGKTAIDLPAAKNLVGAFYQPRMVVADVSTLRSLPKRETMEGWAEAIKHGLILDADLFKVFEQQANQILVLEPDLTTDVIRRSMAIKANVVSQDEKETKGIRVLLNYGHTIGHGLEAATEYGQFLHGEAVAIGMMGAAKIGVEIGVTPDYIVERQAKVFQKFGLPMDCPNIDRDKVLAAMSLDKKAVGSSLRWVFLEDIGRATTRTGVSQEVVERILQSLNR